MTLNPQNKEQTMNIKVKRIQNTRKAGHLAVASVELVDGEGDSLAISRIGICQDYQGQLYVPGPTSIWNEDEKSPTYILQVEPNRQLWRKISGAVLSAYVEWTLKQWQSKSEGMAVGTQAS
jgi:hypothetical protein